MSSFFAMGGYGAFIWPAYAVSLLGLLAMIWQSWAAWRAAKKRLAALEEDKKMSRWIYAMPVAAFAVLAFFLFRSLFSQAPDILPSALIDKPAPAIGPTVLDAATPGFTRADLAAGHVTVINFFASWCVPCRMESAQLMALAKLPGITLYGVDYEERAPGAGRAFLDELGDPFSHIVTDPHGAAGINWGVYGVPETYVVDGKGIVRFKLVGGLTADALTRQLLPEIEKARQAT